MCCKMLVRSEKKCFCMRSSPRWGSSWFPILWFCVFPSVFVNVLILWVFGGCRWYCASSMDYYVTSFVFQSVYRMLVLVFVSKQSLIRHLYCHGLSACVELVLRARMLMQQNKKAFLQQGTQNHWGLHLIDLSSALLIDTLFGLRIKMWNLHTVKLVAEDFDVGGVYQRENSVQACISSK